jgi:hypothetical protein
MDALSTEWRSSVHYALGDRVAFKITGSLGLAAFECLQSRMSSFPLPLISYIDTVRSADISMSDNQVCDFCKLDIWVP